MSDSPRAILDYHTSNPAEVANRLLQRSCPILLTTAFCLILFGAIISLFFASFPVSAIHFVCFGLGFVFLGGLCWLIALIGCNSTFRRSRLKRFLAIPLLVAVLFGLLLSDLPRLGLFYLNKPALDRFATQWMSTTQHPTSARVGIYQLEEIAPIPGGFIAYVRGSNGLALRGAFAYSPKTPPPTHAGDPTPAGSGWYFLACDTD